MVYDTGDQNFLSGQQLAFEIKCVGERTIEAFLNQTIILAVRAFLDQISVYHRDFYFSLLIQSANRT